MGKKVLSGIRGMVLLGVGTRAVGVSPRWVWIKLVSIISPSHPAGVGGYGSVVLLVIGIGIANRNRTTQRELIYA